ncbi:MAG: PAS domain S-box protein [Spirochaetales bacterium]|nr:PAS domain S-box protein [Spirochaetales bacterium]
MSVKNDNQLKAELERLRKRLSELEEEKRKLKDTFSLDSYLLNVLMDNIPDAIYFKNEKSEFTSVSTALAKRFGLVSSEEVIGKTDFDFFSIEHAQQAYNDEQHLMETGTDLVNIEEVETWPDKPTNWVSTTKMCIRDKKGKIIGTFGISRDITLQKKIENALKTSEAKYKDLYDNAPIGYHEIDLEGKIVRVNQTEAKLLGYRVDEMIGKSIMDFLPPKYKKKAKKEIISKLHYTGSLRSTEWKYICKNGKEIDVSLTYRPCYDHGNKPIGAFITVQDISDKKRAQEKLRRTARELKKTAIKLKRSNADLEQFAYIASHDLQEPLRMVSCYLQLIAKRYKDKLDSTADDFINFAVDGAERMQGLINDLLVYSRVDTKGKAFELTDFNQVLDIVKTNLKVTIEESSAEIISGKMPAVMADRGQMEQVFQNLICNAIKFRQDTPPVIDISAKLHEDKWLFAVKDNGIGIDPIYADRIFKIFQRLHLKNEYPGTGIGLSVCKKIIERHDGKIWMEARKEGGTIFYFTIPNKNPEKKRS